MLVKNKFYTAKNDAVFKSIFCNKNDTFLLKELLERCLKKKIEIIKLYPPEVIKKNIYVKGKTLDVLAKADGKIINIEVNSGYYDGMHQRNFGYICEKYGEAIKVGENYADMGDIIQINFTWGLPSKYETVEKYELISLDTKNKYVDNFAIYEFNMDKIKKLWYSGNKEYEFLAILDCDEYELEKVENGDRYMSEFKKKVEDLNDNMEFKQFLSQEEDERKRINTFKFLARKEGLEEGKKEGMKQGMKEGMKDSIKEGMKEGKIEVIKNLINMKMSLEDISKATGFSLEEIEKIK